MSKMKPGNPLARIKLARSNPIHDHNDAVKLAANRRGLTEDEVVMKIQRWLHGLETALQDTLRRNITDEERACLTARRGIYSGIADDIRNGNWKRAVP